MSLRRLVKIATKLDSKGFTKEADILDQFIQKLAGTNFEEEKYGLSDVSGPDYNPEDSEFSEEENESEPNHESIECQECYNRGYEAGIKDSSGSDFETSEEVFPDEETSEEEI